MNSHANASLDLCIVGAGFAGLACARAAASLGLDTAVLERKTDPGRPCRTTGILVKEAAEALEAPSRFTRRIRGVRLYTPSLRSVDLATPGYAFFATDTPGLLRWLALEAREVGARLILGEPYHGAHREGTAIRLAGKRLEARFLVGADGARSRVAADFGLGTNRRFLIGVEAEIEGVRGVDEGMLHCFLDSRLAPGYIAWVVPGVGVTQVGLACSPPHVPRLDRFIERIRRLFDFGSSRVVERRSGRIPVGGAVRPLGAPGVLLVGDAAGVVSPLTAGGIHGAVRHGRFAARLIAEHLGGRAADPVIAYERGMPRYRVKSILRRALDLAPPNAVLDALLPAWPARALARAVFFPARDLLPAAARQALPVLRS